MDGLLELEAGQPTPMCFRPGRSVIMMATKKQKAAQLLACLTNAPYRRLTRTHEIAYRFVGLIRNPDRGQLSRPMQGGKLGRITPVGLDPIARLARDQRRGDHLAVVAKAVELSLDAVTAWTSLIAEPELTVSARQLRRQRLHRGRRVGDLTIHAHLTPQPRLR